MEQLLEMAQKACDQAEIFTLRCTTNTVSFENAQPQDLETSIQSGLSLRIIKDGRLGFAYTRNLTDRAQLLQNALESLKGGVPADYAFPLTTEAPRIAYDPSVESLDNAALMEEAGRVCGLLASSTDGEIMATACSRFGTLRLLNSAGTDLRSSFSKTSVFAAIIYPGSGTGIGRVHAGKRFSQMPAALLDEMLLLYSLSSQEAAPSGGKMKVLFMPGSMHALTWRLQSALSAKNVFEKVSPLTGRTGERILDAKITLLSDPLDDADPDARAFDDEGTPCRTLSLVENGVLQRFYSDLNYARKLNLSPTGHGFKSQQWGGDIYSLLPVPTLSHLRIAPGDLPLTEMIKSMDKGLIVEGALGAHSGNIPNGDYSIGGDPALYVEKGEIVGRAKDVMVAGNIYDALNKVIALEDTLHRGGDGWVPAVLCDGVNVSVK
jgi:PmbA protein